jgi:C1A family cysteine protease
MDVNPSLDLGTLRTTLREEGSPWEMAYTSITALSEEERVIRLGVPELPGLDVEEIDANAEEAREAVTAATADAISAPAAFDCRNVNGVNYTTPVKNQGGCGSCVAFGVAAAMEHVIRFTRRTANLPIDLSEAHLFYCHGRNAGARCNTGWWPDQALAACRSTGITFEDYYPYTSGDQACSNLNADWRNRLATVVNYANISNNAAAMKDYIANYGSIVACMVVFQDFFSYRSGVYRHVSGSNAGGHCVTLVGYSDSERCWIGKNSWGTGWGDGGYFKIAYGQCNIEGYQTLGVSGVNLRTWLPNQQVTGLWTNESDSNVWAHLQHRGWLKLNGVSTVTSQAMLTQLAAAKALNRPVGVFENAGTITQYYAW